MNVQPPPDGPVTAPSKDDQLNMSELREPLFHIASGNETQPPALSLNVTINGAAGSSSASYGTSTTSTGHGPPASGPVNGTSRSNMPTLLANGGLMYLPFPNALQRLAGGSATETACHESPTRESSAASLADPSLLDGGWPEPAFRAPQSQMLTRTKSFIYMATTVAGAGTTPGTPVTAAGTSVTAPFSAHITPPTPTSAISAVPAPIPTNPELDYLQLIFQASLRVYDVATETPLQFAKNLSGKLGRGHKVYFKREELQPVFSFKIRGAYNRIVNLSAEERKRGVIAMSAGNHAQGVAMSALKLGIKATIVMPTSASEIKYTAVRRLGATVILYGADLEEAKKEAMRLVQEHGYVFIPPFDDPHIIAGQGTCGMEIIRQMRNHRIDAIFIPVGGGGLIAGVAAFIKRVQPSIKIIGVNTVDSNGMATSITTGKPVQMSSVGLFSDGTAVKMVGSETHRLCSKLVDDMVLVTVDEICAAIKDVFDDTRSILEPSGALGVAGIKKFLAERGKTLSGRNFIAVTSGANMNFDRLRFVSERSRIGEGVECLLSCKIEERPGRFMELYSMIAPRSVTEISYRYCDPAFAHNYIAFECMGGKEEMQQVVDNINNAPTPMHAIDITENEMAKSHLRFLAGGRAPAKSLQNEKLYRFSFPERPGALKQFLELLKRVNNDVEKWNMSLIHYRNTGGDVARVLIGMDVPPEAEASSKLDDFLKAVGLKYTDETSNPCYEHFLR